MIIAIDRNGFTGINTEDMKRTNMNNENLPGQIQYDPDNLLTSVMRQLNLKNDAALSRALEVGPPVISKIRHRKIPVGASMLIRMHEVTNLSIENLRSLMGDRRSKFRISDKPFKPQGAQPRQPGAVPTKQNPHDV